MIVPSYIGPSPSLPGLNLQAYGTIKLEMTILCEIDVQTIITMKYMNTQPFQ